VIARAPAIARPSVRLAADENFNNNIVRGLLRRRPDLDFVRVQDVCLSGADDPTVPEWAPEQGRAIVSHDVSTLRKHAYERVAAGLKMPGVFEVPSTVSIGRNIGDLLLIVECTAASKANGRGRFGTCLSNRNVHRLSDPNLERPGDCSVYPCPPTESRENYHHLVSRGFLQRYCVGFGWSRGSI